MPIVRAFGFAAVTVILAEPLNETPLMVRAVVSVAAEVAVDALPVKAPTNVVEVTETKPTNVVLVPPNEIPVLPMAIKLFCKLALEIPALPDKLEFVSPLIVFEPAAIVLLVNV